MVAQEINTYKREDVFAATAPFEAKKMLMSLAVTEGVGLKSGCRSKDIKLDFIGVRRAYFHARASREIYIQLLAEDDSPGMCGLLRKAMYGTRDVAQNWEFSFAEELEA